MRIVYNISMKEDLLEKLKDHCKQHDIPVSIFIRHSIREKLERGGLIEPGANANNRSVDT